MNPIDQGALFVSAGAAGFFLSRLGNSDRFTSAVGLLNIWVALPGLFFVIYAVRGILAADIGIVAFSFVFTFAMVSILLSVSKGMQADVRGAVVLNGAFVNAVNLPFPILQLMMGTYAYAATFAATTTALQVVVARLLQQRFGTAPEKGTRASMARAVPLLAIGVGVLVHYWVWPSAPSSGLLGWADLAENALIATIFVHFGVALARSIAVKGKGLGLPSRPFLATALARTVIGPIIALLLALPLGMGSAVYLQMVFVATMPPAIVNTLISRVYGFDADSSAKWTTILTPINTVEGVAFLLILGG